MFAIRSFVLPVSAFPDMKIEAIERRIFSSRNIYVKSCGKVIFAKIAFKC